jgi:RND family efflux transporter MFP subunit
LPPSSPFEFNVSGIGFIEANTRNINVGSFTSGIVVDVLVKEGDNVKKGQPLFLLDQRTAKADVVLKEELVQSSRAAVEVAKVNVADAEDQVRRAKGLRTGLAITQEEVQKREYALQRMKAQLQLQENELDQAKAQLELAKITLEKLTVTAPTDGIILKVRVRPGEYINEATAPNNSPILMGNNNPFYLRVQIDENDSWRFNPKAKAFAYLKSNKDIHFPISFVRLEPYAQPKQRLSGESTELVDTRVIEIVYKIEGAPDNIFIGQQMDVFIEADKGP